MLRIIVGIALMGAAFVLLFVLVVVGEDSPAMAQIMAALTCESGEEFVQELGAFQVDPATRSSGRELRFYCVNNENQQRDVTAQGIVSIAAMFGVPFLLGLALMIWGIFALARGRRQSGIPMMTTVTTPSDMFPLGDTFRSGTVITIDSEGVRRSELSPDAAADMVQQMFGGLGAAMSEMSGGDLASKLQQLEDARKQNLISEDEYQRLRGEILDGL